jgi:hypothetical protein
VSSLLKLLGVSFLAPPILDHKPKFRIFSVEDFLVLSISPGRGVVTLKVVGFTGREIVADAIRVGI